MKIIIGGKAVKPHESITFDKLVERMKQNRFGLESTGLCIFCGQEQGGCEPGTESYACVSCGKRGVFGEEELLLWLKK